MPSTYVRITASARNRAGTHQETPSSARRPGGPPKASLPAAASGSSSAGTTTVLGSGPTSAMPGAGAAVSSRSLDIMPDMMPHPS